MMETGSFRLGTRGSDLALQQAETIQTALTRRTRTVELRTVETEGDRLSDDLIRELGRTGAFVRDLDERVLAGDLEAAVHSLKDMPTQMPEDLVVAAIPERAPPHDVLITPDGRKIDRLPPDATIGTSSLRREAQLKRVRSDLEVMPIRGNVDTRIEKLLGPHLRERREGLEADDRAEWIDSLDPLERSALDREMETKLDGIVLAAAGIERSGIRDTVPSVTLPIETFVPAPGQGALAVTMRDSKEAERVHDELDHPSSRVEVTVERTILATLGGGCIAPIGVFAALQGDVVRTRVQVLSRDGTDAVEATRELPADEHVTSAKAFAEDLAHQGATELIAAAKRTTDRAPREPDSMK